MPTPEAESLIAQARAAATRGEALERVGEAVAAQLLDAMKASGIAKAEQQVEAIRRAGLHRLLAESIADGRVRHAVVTGEVDRLRRALAERSIPANDIKLGILAFDEAAQRLALVAGKNGGFVYPANGNRARDSLITFARSLHR